MRGEMGFSRLAHPDNQLRDNTRLHFELWDKDLLKADDFLGAVVSSTAGEILWK